jgi:DNA-binding NarL/FixJ family response regulator
MCATSAYSHACTMPAPSAPPASPASLTTVAFVDDDAGYRETLQQALASQAHLKLLWWSADLDAAMAQLNGPAPDVMLVDLGLPSGSGLQLIKAVRHVWPACDLIVVTVFADANSIVSAIKAGAVGYLLKSGGVDEIAAKIAMVQAGGSPISPAIARRLIDVMALPLGAASLGAEADPGEVTLTPRELQVLQRTNKGFTVDEVAAQLAIAPATVRTYVKRTYAKLEVRSRTEAIYEARRQGIRLD